MTQIPNLAASAMQSVLQQRQASQNRETDETRQAENRQSRDAKDDLAIDTLDVTDDDNKIHAEAGQGGGQGRTYSESSEEETKTEEETPPGFIVDDEGQMHIDMEA